MYPYRYLFFLVADDHVFILLCRFVFAVPSESPQSLRAESHVSVTSIPLTWRPIPAPSVHGVLRGYKVRYHAVSIGGIKTRARHVSERWVGAGSPSTVLLNLQSYAVYRIEVVGFTNRGTGPPAVVVAGKPQQATT